MELAWLAIERIPQPRPNSLLLFQDPYEVFTHSKIPANLIRLIVFIKLHELFPEKLTKLQILDLCLYQDPHQKANGGLSWASSTSQFQHSIA